MNLPLDTGRLVYSDIIEQVADEVMVTDKKGIIEYVICFKALN